MSGNIVIHDPGNVSDQITKTLCNLCLCLKKLSRLLITFLDLTGFRHIQCIKKASLTKQYFQCFICIQTFSENRKCTDCIHCGIHTIIDISLQCQLSVVDDGDAAEAKLDLYQHMGALSKSPTHRMIDTVTCIIDADHGKTCIFRKLLISSGNGLR